MIALLVRDLRLAVRAGGGFGLGLAFFLIVTVLVPFAVGPEGETLSTPNGVLPGGLMSLNGLALLVLGILPGGLMALCVRVIESSLSF